MTNAVIAQPSGSVIAAPPARWGVGRLLLTVALGALGWAVVAAACLCVGSTGVGLPARWQLAERIEPVLLSSLVGAALAMAGVAYQAVLRNPLAEPYLLGVSTGAALATYLYPLLFAAPSLALWSTLSQQGFAFVGAAVAVGVTFMLSQRRGRLDPVTLLLVGVIVNAINGAVFLLLYHLNLRRDVTDATGGPYRLLVGGIQQDLGRAQIVSAAACVAIGWGVLMWASGKLNVAPLGESEAEALGVRIHRLRWLALGLASLVTAAAVSISGPIGFVGLICPHLGRLVVGRDQRRLLPVATALGAALLAFAEAASRTLSSAEHLGNKLPVGVLTGLLGGPFFLLLLWQNRRASG